MSNNTNETIDERIERYRHELCHCPDSSTDRLPLVIVISGALSDRYRQLGGIEYLEESITYSRQGIDLYPIGNSLRPYCLDNLANGVYTRFEQLGRMEDLEEAITCHREALALRPLGHLERSSSLSNLGVILSTRFDQSGKMEDLEEAITCHREALALFPQGHPNRSSSLNNLANAVCTRFEQLGRMEDLEEAITCHREALALFPHGHPNRSSSLNNLATAVSTRFEQLGRMEDLEEAIIYHREALALLPHGHPDRSSSLDNLAGAVSSRFDQSGVMQDLEEAIRCHREALALRPLGHPDHSSSLNNLANAVSTCFEQLGRMEDLEEAITCHREALALFPRGHPNRSSSLSNLGVVVSTRFDQSGKMEDLEEAITCHREALALFPHGHPNRSSSLSNLGVVVATRFDQSGKMEDLEEAIRCHREALTLRPLGHPDHSSSLNDVANAVSARFRQLGKLENLEEAIRCHREALALLPLGHPNRSSSLNNLANTVRTRFGQLGKMEDLEEAIRCHREALALLPLGHPDRSSSLDILANAVSTRFEQLGTMEDLEEAIRCHREALALLPLGHPNRSSSLNNLANDVSTRFERSGMIGDLEEAIRCHREALALLPLGHPDRSSSLNNLANTVSTGFEQSGRMQDLHEALEYICQAKAILPTEHPRHAVAGADHAHILLQLCDIVPNSDRSLRMTSEAFVLFKHAADHPFASLKDRFHAAVRWAQEARHCKHQSIVQAYAQSLSLLVRCLVLVPTVESQQNFLAGRNIVPRGLALDAASGAIDAGDLRSAVELLEQGRAILWSKLRGYRHRLDDLRAIDKNLADQFEVIVRQLERLATSSESRSITFHAPNMVNPVTSVSFEAKMQHHRILSKDWDDIVRKIRQIDGFADFLQAVPFATLQKAAAEGPVIIVNISRYRSDAIILLDVGDPVLVPLPEISPDVLNQLSSQLTRARAPDGKDSARQILPILRNLWNNIAFPVREQLIALGVPDKSRIWWCPTSDLCALPLHAAGAYSPKVAKPNNLPDCYISSYTPTLSALIRARSGVLPRSTGPHLLVVAQPDDTLPEVEKEISCIRQVVNNVDVLKGSEANHDTVLSSLRYHSWAHFACHGHLNKQPFHSSLQLHNYDHLALVDLIRAELPDAELAFLSACHTAAGDFVGTPDEVVHLAAALQFCGFRSVVGTLWAMEDVDGCTVAEYFYRHMFRTPGAIPNFRDSAEALNLATREMRKRLGLDRWIKFVHIGA